MLKISSELQLDQDARDQSLIASHANPSKFVPVLSVWNQLKIREIYMGQYQHRKNNGFPFLDILGYLKNTHKNPKFGKVRQIPIRELGWEFPGWDLSHFAKFGIFMGILYIP